MTKKINNKSSGVLNGGRDNIKGQNSNATSNISKSRDVKIYHQEGKSILYFMGMITVAMSLMFGFCLHSITNLENKVAGIMIGLTSID